MLDELRTFTRFAVGLPGFLARTLTAEECRRIVRDDLARREQNFLHVVERGIFGFADSPYRGLMRAAGVELEDVRRLVADEGVDGTLAQLCDAGVYISFDEFKGTRAIERPGFTATFTHADFDNPLLSAALSMRDRGSRGAPRRLLLDLDFLAQESVYQSLFFESAGLGGRPLAQWRPAPGGRTGLKNAIRFAKLGRPMERWFSQTPVGPRRGELKEFAVVAYALLLSRILARRMPLPRHVASDEAVEVARWLAAHVARGTPGVLNAPAGAGVRVCLAALEHGLAVEGSTLILGGEPYTEAKARVVAEAGVRAFPSYSLGEAGHLGIACATPQAPDDFHLFTDKVAVVQRPRRMGSDGATVDALFLTTLLPNCPKLMLNVDSGDYATLGVRDCGCLLGEIGFKTHLHGVRSYEKLTSEGVTFLGDQLFALVEEVLPARFGGAPTDFQLVEEEVRGLPKVALVVSPRLGPLDEAVVAQAALDALGSRGGASRLMSELWEGGETLRVVRREPYATANAKVLPLHVLEGSASAE